MTMEATTPIRKRIATVETCGDDSWPQVTTLQATSAALRNSGVTLGWRLKNVGLKRLGLWLVHRCHQGGGASS